MMARSQQTRTCVLTVLPIFLNQSVRPGLVCCVHDWNKVTKPATGMPGLQGLCLCVHLIGNRQLSWFFFFFLACPRRLGLPPEICVAVVWTLEPACPPYTVVIVKIGTVYIVSHL